MKVQLVDMPPERAFKVFTIAITVEDREQLQALTMAAGRMCNGHGNDLFCLLKNECEAQQVDVVL